ncbi:hypothetical protein [Streptomyces prunicolor]
MPRGRRHAEVEREPHLVHVACFSSWEYDRLDAPCPEPATHTVRVDDDGSGGYAVCDGHALTARSHITNGQVVPGLPV